MFQTKPTLLLLMLKRQCKECFLKIFKLNLSFSLLRRSEGVSSFHSAQTFTTSKHLDKTVCQGAKYLCGWLAVLAGLLVTSLLLTSPSSRPRAPAGSLAGPGLAPVSGSLKSLQSLELVPASAHTEPQLEASPGPGPGLHR